MNLQQRPLFLLTITYLCGIVCAVQMSSHAVVLLGSAVGVALVGCAVCIKSFPRIAVALLACVFVLGFARTFVMKQVPPGDVSEYALGKCAYVTGTVASDPISTDDSVRFILKSSRIKTYTGEFPTDGRVMVTLYRHQGGKAGRAPSYGEVVRVHGRLKKPESPSNPGMQSYRDYLARRQVYSTVSASMSDIAELQPARWSIEWAATKFKTALTSKALELFSPVHAFLLLGLLLGNYASLPLEIQASFMRSGTMHLLAASGYNCGVVAGMVGFLLNRLTVPRPVTHVLLIASLWMFTLVAGASPSIVRASVMLSVFLAAYLFRRASDMVNIMLAASLVILALNPLSLFDVGFQLSFAAVASIILIMPLIEPKLSAWFAVPNRTPCRMPTRALFGTAKYIVLALVVSVVALLGTWPITAYYFNYFSAVSIPANAFTALLVIALTWTGIAVLVVGGISAFLGRVCAVVVTVLAGAMIGIVRELGGYPWSCISVQSPSPTVILVYYLILFGGIEYAYRKMGRVQRAAANN